VHAKAAVLHTLGAPLTVSDIVLPAPAPGQVLVELAYSGVCRSQLMEARGGRGEDRYLPHLLGHEGAGSVRAVGAGVTKVAPGDLVVVGWIKGEGMDVPGPNLTLNGARLNAGAVTTFATASIVSENRCTRLPEGVPLELGVLFGCALPTGAGMVLNQLKPHAGASVAVFGLGGIGISALLALGLFDCSRIFAIDVEEQKLELARACGATDCINASDCDPLAEIVRLTGGAGVDYAVEAAGTVGSIENAFRSVCKFGGLCVFASHPPTGERLSIDPHDLISGRRLEGSWGGGCLPDRDLPRFAELYRQGKLPLERLIGRRYPLTGINDALDDLERRSITRALIEMPAGGVS
jgi:S-(hydroxymethyl)glutathione dehydrogenase / alcohol dehydrogenase